MMPSLDPNTSPPLDPINTHSFDPSIIMSLVTSKAPADKPSSVSSSEPSKEPSEEYISVPSYWTNEFPSGEPSSLPSLEPSKEPYEEPSSVPLSIPSVIPSNPRLKILVHWNHHNQSQFPLLIQFLFQLMNLLGCHRQLHQHQM